MRRTNAQWRRIDSAKATRARAKWAKKNRNILRIKSHATDGAEERGARAMNELRKTCHFFILSSLYCMNFVHRSFDILFFFFCRLTIAPPTSLLYFDIMSLFASLFRCLMFSVLPFYRDSSVLRICFSSGRHIGSRNKK